MDSISESWFPELEHMEETLFLNHQCENMESFDEELAPALGEDFQNCLSPESNNSCPSTMIHRSNSTNTLCASPAAVIEATKRPVKQLNSNGYYLPGFGQPSSTPIILNFSNSKHQKSHGQKRSLNPDEKADLFLNNDEEEFTAKVEAPKKANSRVRPPSQTNDHIIAERKRREQLSQLFVALSAIVPGLKKMDKTSVLGDGIKYLKQLQDRVKELEKQTTKQNMESVVLVKKSQLLVDEGEGSSDENFLKNSNDSLPEIEARVCDKSVLIRIHCEKCKGVVVKMLSEVEKLNLFVTSTSVMPFGILAFEITIIAKMENEFQCTTKGLVKSLRALLRSVREAV